MNCYLYARKSTESEDRQILSIDAQIKELKTVAINRGLKIVEIFSEAKSAKAPGRPIFNKMMKQVFENQGMNVICWKLDRLARNPVDGGQLIWAIEKKGVNEIVTPHRSFKNNGDDKFWMQLEFGMAKKYIDDLSDNVKRGLRAKLERGVIPGRPPIGYLNDKENKTIKKDPNRFHLVRKIWDGILSGAFTPRTVLEIANKDWGLTTPQFKRIGGTPLVQSAIYKILSNQFYYGVVKSKNAIYPGSHEPMISKNEFDRVQEILGRPSAKPKLKRFAFTGAIKCGECGSMITAEKKINRYGRHYTYYRCTKKKGGLSNDCGQKYVRDEVLEAQIVRFLDKLRIPDGLLEWAVGRFEIAKEAELLNEGEIKKSLHRALSDCKGKLNALLELKLKDLLTDEEYVSEKNKLTERKIEIEKKIADADNGLQIWLEPSLNFFSFVGLAKKEFECGDDAKKRRILCTVGSNFFLKDGILLIEAKKPFQLIVENDDFLHGYRQGESDPCY